MFGCSRLFETRPLSCPYTTRLHMRTNSKTEEQRLFVITSTIKFNETRTWELSVYKRITPYRENLNELEILIGIWKRNDSSREVLQRMLKKKNRRHDIRDYRRYFLDLMIYLIHNTPRISSFLQYAISLPICTSIFTETWPVQKFETTKAEGMIVFVGGLLCCQDKKE